MMTPEELVAAGQRLADLLRQRQVHVRKLRVIEDEMREISDRIQRDLKDET